MQTKNNKYTSQNAKCSHRQKSILPLLSELINCFKLKLKINIKEINEIVVLQFIGNKIKKLKCTNDFLVTEFSKYKFQFQFQSQIQKRFECTHR